MQVVLIKNMIRTVFIVGNNIKHLEVFHPLLKIGFLLDLLTFDFVLLGTQPYLRV